MTIAFFDLDRTLLSVNSGSGWIRSEYADGHINRWQLLRATVWLTRYHLGLAQMDHVLRDAIAAYAGVPEADLRERTRRFYERDVRHQIRPGALTALDRHRAAGDRLVLLTTSSNYLSELVAHQLALDHWLCSRFEVDPQGQLTGRAITLCFGPHKVDLAATYATDCGVDLTDCAFYTDSITDAPMLEAVGRPIVVKPDPRLRRLARARGWNEEDWGITPA